jgi:radical SAM/Cys-rich protein
MTCQHCHVDAGPDRKVENMDLETVNSCIAAIQAGNIKTIDLTGGAPEMNPHFRDLVVAARELDRHVIDRCNLTILLANGFKDIPDFLAEHEVEVVASLPCYLEENADSQRGDGSFQKSIKALQILNELGYGKPDSDLNLTLVYNPVGENLPPSQSELEVAYREQLLERYGIEFTRLFTITNMPISRYLDYLLESNAYQDYMQKLIDAFNPAAAEGLMCRQTLSVSWEGKLYDCDFNQMLELGVEGSAPATIDQFNAAKLNGRKIITNRHCFGCTAGAGSGCQGAID